MTNLKLSAFYYIFLFVCQLRLLHHRSIYKYIHKKHHEWTSPVALTAVYCHPLEHVLVNLCPVLVPIIIVNCHLFVIWLWMTAVVLGTINDHSGYFLPGLTTPEMHDFHHKSFNQCYGAFGILDYLHGTDSVYRATTGNKPLHSQMFAWLRTLYLDHVKY